MSKPTRKHRQVISLLVEGSDRLLYCATCWGWTNYGSVFRVNKDGSGWTELFTGNPQIPGYYNGYYAGALLLGSDGAFYVSTITAGPQYLGTILRLWPLQTPDLLDVRLGSGSSRLSFAGEAGSQYQIFRSTDLHQWSLLNTITMPAGGIYTNIDSAPPAPAAYYRAAWLP